MPFHPTPIPGLLTFEPQVFGDERGYFFESYNRQVFREAGIEATFLQDNEARSCRGVLRGMHRQTGEHAQAKLVRVIEGSVFDVAVDLRPGSSTRFKWYGAELSADNRRQLYIPRGFAHGYLVLSEYATFVYKCDNFYAPQSEAGLRYDDPAIGIEWPQVGSDYVVAERDLAWPHLEPANC